MIEDAGTPYTSASCSLRASGSMLLSSASIRSSVATSSTLTTLDETRDPVVTMMGLLPWNWVSAAAPGHRKPEAGHTASGRTCGREIYGEMVAWSG